MSEEYTLFFSNKCKYSIDFLNKIKSNKSIFNSMSKIEISQSKYPIPPYIKSVPSLIITSNGKSRLLVNKDLFQWLKSNTQQQSNNGMGLQQNGIMDWDPMAMSGGSYSDSFSFIDSNNATEKNFSFLNSNTQSINCPQNDEEFSKGDDFSKKPINQDLEKLMEQRRLDVPSGAPRI